MAGHWLADRIYDRCAYLNCYNGRYSTGHRLFRFPSYKDPRHHLWIRYTGNVRLRGWASATIRRAGLCEDHFEPDSFVDITRQTLKRHAVPKPYSATDDQAKPSPTLLAQIKTLPNCRTMGKKYLEMQRRLKESAASSQQSSDAPSDDPSEKSVKNQLIQTNITTNVKDLCKAKMLKIQEELKSKLNGSYKTVVLEKCKNLETCSASRHATQIGGKARPHFHKIYSSNPQASTNTTKTVSPVVQKKPNVSQNQDKSMDTNEPQLNKPEISAISESITDTKSEDISKNVDKTLYLINVPTNLSENVKSNASSESQDDEHSESTQALKDEMPDHIRRKIVAEEIIADYYKTKDERVFDRCVYLNCNNGKFTTGSRLFRFPLHTDPRLITWIKNTGNPKILEWSWKTIRRAGLCGDHFTDESFCNESRQRLLRSAIPKPFDHEKNGRVQGQDNIDLVQNDTADTFGTDDDYKYEEDEMETMANSSSLENRQLLFVDLSEDTKDSFTAGENNESEKVSSVLLKTEFGNFSKDEVTMDSQASFTAVENNESEEISNVFLETKSTDLSKDELATDLNDSFTAVENNESDKISSDLLKTETTDLSEDEEAMDLYSTTSEIDPDDPTDEEIINETELMKTEDAKSLKCDAMNEEEEDTQNTCTVRDLCALQEQKARLRKTVKQLSLKLKNAKMQKNKLKSQLLAYSNFQIH